jgi:hypothetical protein
MPAHARPFAKTVKPGWLLPLACCLLMSCDEEPAVQHVVADTPALTQRGDHHHRPHWDYEVDEDPEDEASYVFDPWKVRTTS